VFFNRGEDRIDVMGTDGLILEVYKRLDLDSVFHKYVSAWEGYPWPSLDGWDLRIITIV
jgi:hypothetical protein